MKSPSGPAWMNSPSPRLETRPTIEEVVVVAVVGSIAVGGHGLRLGRGLHLTGKVEDVLRAQPEGCPDTLALTSTEDDDDDDEAGAGAEVFATSFQLLHVSRGRR